MKTILGAIAISVTCASTMAFMQQAKPTPPAITLPPDFEYDTFCKKTQQEKRALFRAATPAQKAVIARRQTERFREAHRARLSQAQLDLLGELLTAITPALFERDARAQAQLEALSDRVESTFSDEDQDLMDRDGPCIPAQPLAHSTE